MATNSILDLDSILDGNLDAVVNVPDYVDPPDGVYMVKVKEAEVQAGKKAEDNKRITLTYEVIATVETKGVPVGEGSLFTERFQVTEEGLSYFKRTAKNLMQVESVDGVSIRDILATLKESPAVQVVISHSESETDGKKYSNLRMRIVSTAA